MIELPDQGILYIRVAIGFALLVMYAYNIIRAYREWHRDRHWDTFRQFIMAFELVFGVALIFTGYLNTAFFAQNEQVTGWLRGIGYGLLGVLLVGGFTLLFSWRKPKAVAGEV